MLPSTFPAPSPKESGMSKIALTHAQFKAHCRYNGTFTICLHSQMLLLPVGGVVCSQFA